MVVDVEPGGGRRSSGAHHYYFINVIAVSVPLLKHTGAVVLS